MKLNVFFVKRKHLYLIISIIILLILGIIFIKHHNNKAKSTFFITSDELLYKIDLTGDGREDMLYAKNRDNEYFIQVTTKEGQNIILEPSDKINTLGDYCTYWPLRVTVKDVNRDNIPEIFVQSSHKNKPLQHIFLWERDSFKDICCNNNNILGLIDSKNNKTPKIITGKYSNNEINFAHNILVRNNLKSFIYKCESTYLGKDTICHFINSIQNLSNCSKDNFEILSNIFSSDMDAGSYKCLKNISNETNKLTFQDAFFSDSKYDKNGDIVLISWTLNFNGTCKDTDYNKNYTLLLQLKPDKNSKDKYYFKICSVNLKK